MKLYKKIFCAFKSELLSNYDGSSTGLLRGFALSTQLLTAMFVGLLINGVSLSAHAHKAGITDTRLEIYQQGVLLTYTLPIAEFNNSDELKNRSSNWQIILAEAFLLEQDSSPCVAQLEQSRILEKIRSYQVKVLFACPSHYQQLALTYDLAKVLDDTHFNNARVLLAGKKMNLVLDRSNVLVNIPVANLLSNWQLSLTDRPVLNDLSESSNKTQQWQGVQAQTVNFFSEGFKHIIYGYDHLLYLLVILLYPQTLRRFVIMISAFSLAHAATLTLSALNLYVLPSYWAELMIALSIMYVAIENILLYRRDQQRIQSVRLLHYLNWAATHRAWLNVLFGLFHGFGFSYFLHEIDLGEQLIWTLLQFNLGIEVGQLLVVIVLWPLLNRLYQSRMNWRWAALTSTLGAVMGSYWLLTRVAGV